MHQDPKYGHMILARGWQETKQRVREFAVFEGLFLAVYVAAVFALQGDTSEDAALNTAFVTGVTLAGLFLLTLIYQLLRAPGRLLREKNAALEALAKAKDDELETLTRAKERELTAVRAELEALRHDQDPPPRLAFGRPEIPRVTQPISVLDPQGQPLDLARGRVIRVPVINELDAGEAKKVHARLRFRGATGRLDKSFLPGETQGEWVGASGPETEIDLPGNGRPRLLDLVVVLNGQYPHAFEWTTQSRFATLQGYAIKSNLFRIEVDLMGSAHNGSPAPHLTETIEIECRPGHMLKADWLGPSRNPADGDTWVPW